MKRRTFLAGTTAAAAALTFELPAFAAPSDFAALRAKWAADLTGSEAIDPADPDYAAALGRLDAAVKSSLAKLDRTQTRKLVFTDQPLTADPSIPNTYVRLEQWATAWATPGSQHHADPALLSDVQAALESMNQLIYKTSTVEFGNWFILSLRCQIHKDLLPPYLSCTPCAKSQCCVLRHRRPSAVRWIPPV